VEKFCMFFHSVKEAQQYLPRFTAIEGVEVVQGSPDNIEVTAAGVNKGESLLALADHLGIPCEATLAVGDSENDRAMLEKAGVAAVMANGMEHIRKLADIVSENDNDHDGVAEIFARLGL
jgi:hydroxymethylpyrimidine pyrophosphatase-like HAD family hydrolase